MFWDAGWSCTSSLVPWVFRNLCNGIHLKFCSFSLLTSLSSFQYTSPHYIQYFLEVTMGICELHIILPSHLFFSLENVKAKVESTKAPFGFSSICVKTGFWNPISLMVIATAIFWSSLNFKTHASFFFFFCCKYVQCISTFDLEIIHSFYAYKIYFRCFREAFYTKFTNLQLTCKDHLSKIRGKT